MKAAEVIGRSVDDTGSSIGYYDSNPMLNTKVYDVMFPDGTVQQYAANVIAENLYESCDDDRKRYQYLDEMIGHKKLDSAVPKSQGFIKSKNGQLKPRITTKGWEFLIKWKDGLQSWVPMIDIKESHLVQLAEYAKLLGIGDEPAFAWLIAHALRKRDQIISSVNAQVKKRTMKYGIIVPTTVKEAFNLDKPNSNNYWRDAIQKEMKNVTVAFKILDSKDRVPVGYSKLKVRLVFDIKLDLTRKARLVADGHLTPDPVDSTYADVVSRETVRIALTYGALHGLDFWAADIMNAFVQAPITEKYWIECGPEFGSEHVGK